MAWWVAEAQDCQPLDPISGSALTVQIPEADDQTLLSNNPDFYRKQIRIGGTYNLGVNLQLSQGTAAFNPNTYFAFSTATNSNTGIYIRLIQPVDRDGNAFNVQRVGNSETFSLTCTTNTGTTRTYSLVVQFVDQNDNSPIFQNTPYSVTVNELTPIGLTVYQQITATDADQSNNGQITYSLLAGDGTINDGSRFFAINPTTGVLTVKETLDYEGLSNLNKLYSIQVQATDNPINTAERRTSSQFLSVTITDGDDLGPAFEYSSCFRYSGYCFDPRYTSSITSTSLNTQLVVFPYPPQTPFNQPVTVQARDKDTLNAPIVFDIETTVPSGYASFFSVQTQQQTGSNFYSAFITQTQSINRASVGGKLELILRASEETGHKRSTRATIDVTVSGTNDFDPVVTSSSGNFIGTISEDADAGTPLRAQGSTDAIQLVVTDQDVLPGDPDPTYFFVPDTNLFTVNGKGFISLVSAGSLDFETNSAVYFYGRCKRGKYCRET
uniref:Cadherin domain-containing protein n=1 Tax=Magallana gigas TaxID=29159 RepID=A0A8W8LXK4_MAGGI